MTCASPAMVLADKLSLAIDGHLLLDGVSFSVATGDYCCVIGPNGAGKSTLLKCIDGLHDAWTGRLDIASNPIRSLSRRHLSQLVGYVPQAKGNLPDYTVRDFLRMSRFARGTAAEDDDAIDRALARTGMAPFGRRTLATLSGGECQKVFIAAGLAQDTPLLLLDEPASFLDPQFQLQVTRLIREINRQERKTIISVTHDLNDALGNATKIIAMKRGRVEFVKTPAEIWAERALDGLFETPFSYLTNNAGKLMVTLD